MDSTFNANPVGIKGTFENTDVNLSAKMKHASPDDKQREEDDLLLKNIGDSRDIIQQGAIHSPDGSHRIPTELVFRRTRNANGGVDVTCFVPCLGADAVKPE